MSGHQSTADDETTRPGGATVSDEPRASDAPNGSRRRYLRTLVGVGLLGVAGCIESDAGDGTDGGGADTTARPDQQAARTVTVVLDGAPNGLQKYKCTVEHGGDATITEVSPGVVDGNEFQVAAGGTDQSTVTVRAADLTESVGSFEDARPLFSLTYSTAVTAESLAVSVPVRTDDGGESIARDRVRVRLDE
jgi:hypothetical protein